MEIPKKIKEAIEYNRLVIFVGSGLSIKFGLPSWKTLVCDIIKNIEDRKYDPYIQLLDSNTISPILVLDQLKQYHNNIQGYIKGNFQLDDEKVDLQLHANILELSGKVITTNYDNAFELASRNGIIPAIYTSDYNISEINKNEEKYIFKLHGSYTEPDHCVLFSSQYENLYSNETAAREKLKSIFTDKTILFLGFSFNDPNINLIFNNLDKAFGNNNKHYIIANDIDQFKSYNFLNSIQISEYSEIDSFIEDCLNYKKCIGNSNQNIPLEKKQDENFIPKIAILIPKPIDIEFHGALDNIVDCFNSIESQIFLGSLNVKTLENIEDYDLVIIVSKVFKSKLYIEDDNLKGNLLSPSEICTSIPNDEIPIVFITDEKIEPVENYQTINISTLKSAIIKRFVFKSLKEGKLDYSESEISIYLTKFLIKNLVKGSPIISSIYNNNRNLEIGKKCLTNVIGRVEEQSLIASKLINITKTNKLLNIKASGGTGKTTLIKKVAYELYNRGYFKEGVNFRSCENIKTYNDFEEILINAFNLTNIIDFKGYLIDNYSNNKIDLLVILDNFETINSLNKEELHKSVELLKFATDYTNVVITSREKISSSDDFEDVYSLTPLITDDAFNLFQKYYGIIKNDDEIKILRQDILEELLNNNPLAIKLVTKSRTNLRHISELKAQLQAHFFESINEDYSSVFSNNADLNIERTKSIFQSINYSYTTLSPKEKIAFELLSLFPDGISLSNFKRCFLNGKSKNHISDSELRNLRDKSLVEDYNGNLQLQPIIRRFADFQFNKRTKEIKQKYCSDAYSFNCFILDTVDLIEKQKSLSEALKLFNLYKNNLLAVLNYIRDIEISENSGVSEKKYLLNYIYGIDDYILSEKQIQEFSIIIITLQNYFDDLPNAKKLIDVLSLNKVYYHKEFDRSYDELKSFLSVDDMEKRLFKNEDLIERKYKDIISNIHSMEGHTLKFINSIILNNDTTSYLDAHFFYLGISDNISRKKDGFYYFEYELMFDRLDVKKLEEYIGLLYPEEHLEIMQSTYTLSKVKKLNKEDMQKLVVTNPYTKGLKELMFAFVSYSNTEKIVHFEESLINLSHIKYYYLEALYYYCVFLKDLNSENFNIKINEGLSMSNSFYYQYLNFLFKRLKEQSNDKYVFSYSYYPVDNIERFVLEHNNKWEKIFKERNID